jgi:hypothetical protein
MCGRFENKPNDEGLLKQLEQLNPEKMEMERVNLAG